MSQDSRKTAQAGSGRRTREVLGAIAIRVAPVLVGIFVYQAIGWRATGGNFQQELDSVQHLLQVTIGILVSVAGYTIVSEYSLSRMPRRLSRELEVLVEELTPLRETVAELNTTVNKQLEALIDLHGMEILYDQQEALTKARLLQGNASKSIHAMWTNLPYDEALQQYFSETLAQGSPFASRIVAASNVPPEHLLDHIDKMWDRLADESYEIYLVHDSKFEALVVDRKTAALFFYSGQGYGSAFIASSSDQFVDTVEGIINGLKNPEWRLPVNRNTPKDLATVRDWIHTYYQAIS
jgi:hypothetical protein